MQANGQSVDLLGKEGVKFTLVVPSSISDSALKKVLQKKSNRCVSSHSLAVQWFTITFFGTVGIESVECQSSDDAAENSKFANYLVCARDLQEKVDVEIVRFIKGRSVFRCGKVCWTTQIHVIKTFPERPNDNVFDLSSISVRGFVGPPAHKDGIERYLARLSNEEIVKYVNAYSSASSGSVMDTLFQDENDRNIYDNGVQPFVVVELPEPVTIGGVYLRFPNRPLSRTWVFPVFPEQVKVEYLPRGSESTQDWVKCLSCKPHVRVVEDGYGECEYFFYEVTTKKLRYRTGDLCRISSMALNQIDFLFVNRGPMGYFAPQSTGAMFNEDGHLQMDFNVHTGGGIMKLLSEKLLLEHTGDANCRHYGFQNTCVMVKGILLMKKWKPVSVKVVVKENMDKQTTIFNETLNENVYLQFPEGSLSAVGLILTPADDDFHIEIFGQLRCETNKCILSLTGPSTFPLDFNPRMGFLYEMNRCRLQPHCVGSIDKDGTSLLNIALVRGVLHVDAIFCRKPGSVCVTTPQKTKETVNLHETITKVDHLSAVDFVFSSEIDIDDIELFGEFEFKDCDECYCGPDGDGEITVFWPASESLERGFGDYIINFASSNLRIPGCTGLMDADTTFVEYWYSCFSVTPRVLVMPKPLHGGTDHPAILKIQYKELAERADVFLWKDLAFEVLDDDVNNDCFHILIREDVTYRCVRITLGSYKGPVQHLKTWGTIHPVDEYQLLYNDNYVRFMSLSARSLFLTEYAKVSGKKFDVSGTQFSFDNMEVAPTMICCDGPPENFTVAVGGSTDDRQVIGTWETAPSMWWLDKEVWGSKVFLSQGCRAFDFTCNVRPVSRSIDSSKIVCAYELCPLGGILEILKSTAEELSEIIKLSCGKSVVLTDRTECLQQEAYQEDHTIVVDFLSGEILPTTVCFSLDLYALLVSVTGSNDGINHDEIGFTPVEWSRCMVVPLSTTKFYRFIHLTFSHGAMSDLLPIRVGHLEFFGTLQPGHKNDVPKLQNVRRQVFPFRLDRCGILQAFAQSWAKDLVHSDTCNRGLIIDFSEVSVFPTYVYKKSGKLLQDCVVYACDHISRAQTTKRGVMMITDGRLEDNQGTGGRCLVIESPEDLSLDSIELAGYVMWNCDDPEPTGIGFREPVFNPFNGCLRSRGKVRTYVGVFGKVLKQEVVYWGYLKETFEKFQSVSLALDFGDEPFALTSCALQWSTNLDKLVEVTIVALHDRDELEVRRCAVGEEALFHPNVKPATRYQFVFTPEVEEGYLEWFEIFGSPCDISDDDPVSFKYDGLSTINVPVSSSMDLVEHLRLTYDGLDQILDVQPEKWRFLLSSDPHFVRFEEAKPGDKIEIRVLGGRIEDKMIHFLYLGSQIPLDSYTVAGKSKSSRYVITITFVKEARISHVKLYGDYKRLPVTREAEHPGNNVINLGSDPLDGALAFIEKSLQDPNQELDLFPYIIEPNRVFFEGQKGARILGLTNSGWKTVATFREDSCRFPRVKCEPIRKIKVDGTLDKMELFGVVRQICTGRLLRDCTKGLLHLLSVNTVDVTSSSFIANLGLVLATLRKWDRQCFTIPGPSAELAFVFNSHSIDLDAFAIMAGMDPDSSPVGLKLDVFADGKWTTALEVPDASGLLCHRFNEPFRGVSKLRLSGLEHKSLVFRGLEFFGEAHQVETVREDHVKVSSGFRELITSLFDSSSSPGLFTTSKTVFSGVPNDFWNATGPTPSSSFRFDSSLGLDITKGLLVLLRGIYLSSTSPRSRLVVHGVQGHTFVKLCQVVGEFSGYIPIKDVLLINKILLFGPCDIKQFEIYGAIYKDSKRVILPRQVQPSGVTAQLSGLLFNGLVAAIKRNTIFLDKSTIIKAESDSKPVPLSPSGDWDIKECSPNVQFLFDRPHLAFISEIALRLTDTHDDDIITVRLLTEYDYWQTISTTKGPFLANETLVLSVDTSRPCKGVSVSIDNEKAQIVQIELFGSIHFFDREQSVPLKPPEVPISTLELCKGIIKCHNPEQVYNEYMRQIDEALVFSNPDDPAYPHILSTRETLLHRGFGRHHIGPSSSIAFPSNP